MKRVSVLPAETGWLVRSDVLDNDQLFLSGGKAEAAGRRLVRAIEAGGEAARLEVRLRDGSVAIWRPSEARSWSPTFVHAKPEQASLR